MRPEFGSRNMPSRASNVVRDTGIEPVTSSVSGKRSPAELIARDPSRRWRRESNPCARLCRPLPHHSATPPLGLMRLHHRADDGIRTRDPNLGKVVRYQLRHVRAPRASSSPIAKDDDSASTLSTTNPLFAHGCRGSEWVRVAAERCPIHGRHRRSTASSSRYVPPQACQMRWRAAAKRGASEALDSGRLPAPC